MTKKFKNDDSVMIKKGEFKGYKGKVVDDEAPVLWVMLSNTNEVVNVHEDEMEIIK